MGCKEITRPASRRARRSGMSPYQRHGKTPFVYSTRYYGWRGHIRLSNGIRENEATEYHSRQIEHSRLYRQKRRAMKQEILQSAT